MKSTLALLTVALAAATTALASPLDHRYPATSGFLPRVSLRQTPNNGTGTPAGGGDGANLQTFTGALGGAAPPVTNTGDAKRPFATNGDTFVALNGALGRSCDVQKNACARQANAGDASVGPRAVAEDVAQCEEQNKQCHAAFQ